MKKSKKINRLHRDAIFAALGFFLGITIVVIGNIIVDSSSEERYIPTRNDLVKITKGFDRGCIGEIQYYNDTLAGPKYFIDCEQGGQGYAYQNEMEQIILLGKEEIICIPGKKNK